MPNRDYALEVEIDFSPPGSAPGMDEDARFIIATDGEQIPRDDETLVLGGVPEALQVESETIVINTDGMSITRSVN